MVLEETKEGSVNGGTEQVCVSERQPKPRHERRVENACVDRGVIRSGRYIPVPYVYIVY